jgi:hypothetical protein
LVITAGPHGSRTNAWAAGCYYLTNGTCTLILHWNGTGWSTN